MWYICATAFSQYFRSLTWLQPSLSLSIAFTHASFVWSRDTPKTVKFLAFNLLYTFTTFGFSILHVLHQLAQKSSNTYLPLKEESLTGLPSTSFCVKSKASVPTAPILE